MARIVSFVLVFAMLAESFLGSANIVLAANQEETDITTGTESGNLEGTVTEDGSESNSSNDEEYNTEGLDILFEVEENRDRTSKHYRLSDGTIMAADYGMDVHYEKDGQWKDIDNRFVYEAPTAAPHGPALIRGTRNRRRTVRCLIQRPLHSQRMSM